MIIVLDTNVIMAAFAAEGLCHSLFELCIDQHEICISDHILSELSYNLYKKLKLPRKIRDDIKQYLVEVTTIHTPPALSKAICRDKNDDMIISLAEAVKADYLITGDKDLLILKKYKDIPILTPRDFWKVLRDKK